MHYSHGRPHMRVEIIGGGLNVHNYARFLQILGSNRPYDLAKEILAQQNITPFYKTKPETPSTEVEDCIYDATTNCWLPTGRTERIFWRNKE